jgi:hypothetical protein
MVKKESVTTYHGTSQKFDEFDEDKIQTGVGKTAYGWGFYVTEVETVAKYFSKLANNAFFVKIFSEVRKLYDEKKISLGGYYILMPIMLKFSKYEDMYDTVYDYLSTEAPTRIKDIKRNYNVTVQPQDIDKANEYYQYFKTVERPDAYIYKIEIHKGKNPSDYKFLNWDEPFVQSQRDELSNALESEGMSETMHGLLTTKWVYGNQIYRKLSGMMMDGKKSGTQAEKEASLFLRDKLGYTGNRYQEDGNINYVIFDKNALSIEEIKISK